MVNSNEFAQQVCMKKGKMPNFICFTEHQKQDLKLFSSFTFENKTGVVMSKISKYPKFVGYFRARNKEQCEYTNAKCYVFQFVDQ